MWLDRLSWAEINHKAIINNFSNVRKIVGKRVKICAVLKANAYGHGLDLVAKILGKSGVYCFGVASLNEALYLRNEGISKKIILLGYSDPFIAKEIVEYDLIPTVYSFESVEALSKAAFNKKKILPVHIKVDTGMGRLGLLPEEAKNFIKRVNKLPNIKLEGIFTHFACSEENENKQNKLQIARFKNVLKELKTNGIVFPIVHAANSGGVLNFPESHFNMVRPGLILYGYLPSGFMKTKYKFIPVMTWKTKVTQVKTLKNGECVSYGCTFRSVGETKVASLAVGYADGVRRTPQKWKEVLIKGKRAKVIGNVCMDQMMVDVTGIKGVEINDEVVLIGEQNGLKQDALDVAKDIGTSHYEVLTSVSARVDRIIV